jgi:hypothetical protein
MPAPRLVALQRGLGDEQRGLDHVRFLGRARWQAAADVAECCDSSAKLGRVAVDADVIPHDLADSVSGDLCGASIAQAWG